MDYLEEQTNIQSVSDGKLLVHVSTIGMASAKGLLRPGGTNAEIQLYVGSKILDGHHKQTTKSLHNVHDANDQPNCDRVNNSELSYKKGLTQ